jgi:myo-inositol-1(or 4)-monophosphatase
LSLARDSIDYKGDDSPVTELEQNIELVIKAAVAKFDPETVFLGEETGGTLPSQGRAVAVDPVDGTWAYVTGSDTYATTLTVFEDGKPVVAIVGNPSTGELAYAIEGYEARLIRLSCFGEPDRAVCIPTQNPDRSTLLINLHPSRTATSVHLALQSAWEVGNIRMVRSPGGSPSWAIVEAARGAYTYVNLWSKGPSEPYDLAGAALILRAAGGEISDLEGLPIDTVMHKGPFVAGVERDSLDAVIQLVANS